MLSCAIQNQVLLGRRANSELQPVPDRETVIKYITVLTLVTQ